MKVSEETSGSLIFEEILIKGLLKGMGRVGESNKRWSKLESNESNCLERDIRQKQWLSGMDPNQPQPVRQKMS